MKISFQRTGGFTGIPVTLNVDIDSLPEPDASTLRQMVKNADFFDLTESHLEKQIPDGFQYAITVEDKGQHRTIEATDVTLPEKLRPLVNDLSLRARQRRV
jgi:hypothetical protein